MDKFAKKPIFLAIPYFFHQKHLNMNWLIYVIIIGAVAGWLAGQIMKGGGFGLLGNIIVGVLGGIVGGYLASALGLSFGSNPLISQIVTGVLGAVVLLFVVGLVKRNT